MSEPVCDCYPSGTPPADYEGPQPWCDVHGQPSVAYRVGIQEGQRRLVSEAAIWDEACKAFAWAVGHGDDPVGYVYEHNPYREDPRLHDSANDGALDALMHEDPS